MQATWLDKYFKGDRTIWLIVFILSIFSLLAVYSSTGTLAYRYQSGNTSYYLLKHLIILGFGLVLMYLSHLVKYTYYSKISAVALIFTVPLLIITLMGGTNLNEATRWLTLPGTNITFQTSDFAKLALIMFVARILSKKQAEIKSFRSAFVPVILPVLLVCGLILPANLSTALILFISCCFLMFIGRIDLKYILSLGGIAALCFGLYVAIAYATGNTGRIETWKSRVERFVDGNGADNYQAEQAKIAIATGGILGVFPGNSIQRNYLPHPYSDFIYAIIIEEYGLIGGVLLIVLYLILFFRVIRFIHHSPMAFGTLLSVGCIFLLVFQAMINMAVTVNIFPVTGQPLPMLSMGGTSIWFTSISIGIVLSVSRQVEKEKKEGGHELAAA
ncbi:MAG: FtsW/RodA/SpoVE family cell cycle protein [Bacteroidia bacterium]|nr:FtsW/RodA/SpoVE family cell cycle protein [Bacteroidia bacterium]